MYSLYAFALGVVLLTLVLFVPVLQRLFEIAELTGGQLAMIFALAVMPTVLIQLGKMIRIKRR